MKLLFDHNLSPRLVTALADVYPDSSHVYTVGLAFAPMPQLLTIAGHIIWTSAICAPTFYLTEATN